ncbi:hypothetical protein HPB48_010289 [Haemaphysalis longicornis]|uniref:Hexosyltransferase n=1 Tax=Haemaphysalis longicornis TaxID=44386 RepID=A0A9J6FVD7_HAELO|nr:hypothetical protein HPB48_010289 [Haemaphysalis longicornis]
MTVLCKLSRKLLVCATSSVAAYVVFLRYLHLSRIDFGWGMTPVRTGHNLSSPAFEGAKPPSGRDSPPVLANDRLPPKSSRAGNAEDRYTFTYILNKPNICSGSPVPTVLIVVISSSINFAQRKAIRETWGAAARRRGYRLVFLVGRPKLKPYQSNIVYEDAKHGDLIQADFTDSYRNLTLKSITMVRWSNEYCPGAKLVLKIDDDMLLNVWDLADRVRRLHGVKRTMWGLLAQKWTPQRNPRSKWYVSARAYRNSSYPDFLAGPSYLLSGDCVSLLARGSSGVPYLYLEDVFLTGIVADKMGIKRVHDEGFLNYRKLFTPCTRPRILASHGYTPLYLKHTWRSLFASAEGRSCDDADLATGAAVTNVTAGKRSAAWRRHD